MRPIEQVRPLVIGQGKPIRFMWLVIDTADVVVSRHHMREVAADRAHGSSLRVRGGRARVGDVVTPIGPSAVARTQTTSHDPQPTPNAGALAGERQDDAEH